MILIKFIILILIVLTTTSLGMQKVKSFKERQNALSLFKRSLLFMKTKIEFTYEPIKRIFEDISSVIYENKDNVFYACNSENEITFYNNWTKAVDKTLKDLKQDDLEIIKNFGKMLGKTDKNGQISEIELALCLIEKQIEDAENYYVKNEKLYKTIGVVSGLALCIIFV